MRFSGQGLMSHTLSTAVSRYFEKTRGKALSTIWFGLSTAEFILPFFILSIYFIFMENNLAGNRFIYNNFFTFNNI